MAAKLQIDDGAPQWWDSQAIWVVPGNDPLGPSGTPAVGDTAYLWARVRNTGSSDIRQVKVDFWVANPGLQLRRSVARFIGSAFADIPAGGQQDVLCLAPWAVELVNGGHECLIAEASSPQDPLSPAPGDPDLIDPVAYRQIAQRNINVITVGPSMMRVLAIGVHAGSRAARDVVVEAHIGGELQRDALRDLGIKATRPAREGVMGIGLSDRPGCGARVPREQRLKLAIPAGRSMAAYLGIQSDKGMAADEYLVVRLVEYERDKVVGGITFVVVAGEER
jgi:hypothetical protein